MALTRVTLPLLEHYQPFNVVGGQELEASAIPRGTLYVHGYVATASQLAADQTSVEYTINLPSNWAYRLQFGSAYWQYGDSSQPDTAASTRITGSLPFQMTGASPAHNHLMLSWSNGGLPFFTTSGTFFSHMTWRLADLPLMMIPDPARAGSITVQGGFTNTNAAVQGVGNFWMILAFKTYDIEQAKNFPANSPIPTNII